MALPHAPLGETTMNQLRAGTALAMSGGGFRAALFHIGSLIRLNELGLLATLARISSVSGGSITAGRLAVAWPRLNFANGIATNLTEEVVAPVRSFCGRDVDRRAVALGALSPFRTIGDVLSDIYDDDLLENTALQSLPDTPRFVFNATNLQTGRLFRISKPYMADYRVGRIDAPSLAVARAVAASSAFPPVLSPVTIDTSRMAWQRMAGADLYDDASYRGVLQLTDGGAYDNLGLETVDDFSTVLVSDAGAPFGFESNVDVSWLQQPLRALDIATDQARALRKRYLLDIAAARGQKVAYWGIDTLITDYALPDALNCMTAITAPLARIRTRLNPFDATEQGQLINWGYALADAGVRRYGPKATGPAPAWPEPAHALNQ
jgi:NTE family protein